MSEGQGQLPDITYMWIIINQNTRMEDSSQKKILDSNNRTEYKAGMGKRGYIKSGRAYGQRSPLLMKVVKLFCTQSINIDKIVNHAALIKKQKTCA